jgi:hypothetical protein
VAFGALFEIPDSSTVVPTASSRGPWDDRHCHGGPVAAILTRAVEQTDDGHPPGYWQVARLTVELTRPVPVGAALRLSTEVERPGRQVSLVAARLEHDDVAVAIARALRIRSAPVDLPELVEPPDDRPPPPDAFEDVRWEMWTDDTPRFHSHSCRHRAVAGAMDEPGPATEWIALRVPVVAGEDPTGGQRVAAAVDFGNGISSGIDSEQVAFINPDLTIHLARPPIGEWVCIASSTHYGLPGNDGAAMAESAVYDVAGRVGRSVQSLILQAR